MNKKVLALIGLLLLTNAHAEDFGLTVQGSDTEDYLSNSKSNGSSPYLESQDSSIDQIKIKHETPLLPGTTTEEVRKPTLKSEFTDTGYTVPGTFDKQENYIEINKDSYTDKMRTHSKSAFNLTYIRDNFDYQSPNNVIARTITQGYKHVQTGFLLLRSDNYFLRTAFANFHWSMGAGLAFNYGKGIFVTGEQSDAQFRLWEIPVDVGVGLEIPITKWFKVSATGGPSALALIQNRSDLTEHETGKNKAQFGFGAFASAQLKFNVSGFGGESAYEMYTTNQISNLFLNLEVRYHNYAKYLEDIKISGTSFGAGVTFEFL